MDTTYFGRRFGIMVLFDSISGKALSVTEVKNETNALYAEAIGSLKAKGIEIQSIVCDGRKGLPQLFADTPVQLCHFHAVNLLLMPVFQAAFGCRCGKSARGRRQRRRGFFRLILHSFLLIQIAKTKSCRFAFQAA